MSNSRKRKALFSLGLALLLVSVSGFGAYGVDDAKTKKDNGEFSWEMPGRVSIYDLQFGPAVFKDNQWQFQVSGRTFNAGMFGDRLTLMIKFSYTASRPETPLKFMLKLPDSRQYEETVKLPDRNGNYTYQFSLHRPEDFVGTGYVYLYYGFSIVDVIDFTIMPGSPQAG
jgi:hypothetical protein